MAPIKLVPRGVRPTAAEDQAVKLLGEALEGDAEHITRVMLHFEEDADLQGRAVVICHAKVTLAKALHVPSFHLEGGAQTRREATELVADAIAGAVRRALVAGKRGRVAERPMEPRPPVRRPRHRREPDSPMSANPPRGVHFHMTRHQARATSAREESATRPSRKSTRKSANRSKRDGNTTARTGRPVRAARRTARG